MTDDRTPTSCKGCGHPILWASYVDAKGVRKSVPLDATAPVWFRVYDPDEGKHFWHKADDRSALVSHFVTCPNSEQFSGKNRDA